MHQFQVSIPALEVIDFNVQAYSKIKAALFVLNQSTVVEKIKPDKPLKVYVHGGNGKLYAYDAMPEVTLNFKLEILEDA